MENLARLVQQHGCGIVIAPGDADALVAVLRRLSNAPGTIAEMGRRARAMLDAHFTRQQTLQRWSELFDQLDKSSASEKALRKACGHRRSLMRTMVVSIIRALACRYPRLMPGVPGSFLTLSEMIVVSCITCWLSSA